MTGASFRCRLERYLQSELNFARWSTGRANTPERGRLNVIVGQSELSSIEQVEEFSFELNGESLYLKVLSCVEIDVQIARPDEVVSPFITEGVRRRDGKPLWVKPLLSRLGGAPRWIGNALSPLWSTAGVGYVATRHGTEWQTAISRDDAADIPAAKNCVYDRIGIGEECLSMSHRERIGTCK